MTKLTILNADGSLYWVEHFNKEEDALVWLQEERSRPHWDQTRTHTVESDGPTEDDKRRVLEDLKSIADQKKKAHDKLASVDRSKVKSIAALAEVVWAILDREV